MFRSSVPTTRRIIPRSLPTWPFIGQEGLGLRLVSALQSGGLPPVLLFLGPHELGKRSAAIWLAQIDLCKSTSQRPCGTCLDCRQIINQTHPFVRQLTGSADVPITIEVVRRLIAESQLRLSDGQSAWLIIAEAEWLTEGAANAWLKFLEEPPPGIQSVLTSSSPDRVLPTLRSRCAVYYWNFVSADRLRQSVAKPIPARVQAMVARSAGRPGRFRILQAEPKKLESEQIVTRKYLQVLIDQDPATIVQLLDDVAVSPQPTLRHWTLALRELLLCRLNVHQRRLWPGLSPNLDQIAANWSVVSIMQLLDRAIHSSVLIERHVAPKHVATELLLV